MRDQDKRVRVKAKGDAMKGRKPRPKDALVPIAAWRIYLVLALLAVIALVLVWRVASLQVMGGVDRGFEFLQQQGQVRTIRRETIPAHRGMITDRRGEPLAVSTPVVTIWANPQHLSDHKTHWAKLAKALRMPYGELKNKLERYSNKEFVYLRRHMSPQDAQKILSLEIVGVYEQREYRRFYPAGEVAAQLVGFTDIDDYGQEGMELAYDNWLRGSKGEKKVLKDLKGRVIKDIKLIASAQSGKDLVLSIDLRVQYQAYRELKAAIKKHRASSGSVVVMDVKTGEVLAMANLPSFNPNNRRGLKSGAIRNRAITDVFEPGSTMKPLTVVAALESGKYKPNTKIDTSPGRYKVGRKILADPVNYGVIDVTKVITKSSQVGMSKIALNLDEQAVREVFYRMGLGQDTGSGFPGESSGVLPNYPRWKPIERVTFAYGYGLSVTTLQLTQAYSVFAGQGKKRPISLLKTEGEVEGEQIVTPRIAKDIMKMLRTVTQKGGTGTRAQISAYTVAGKSGTAHKAGRGGYEDSHYTSIFAGVAPVGQPRVVTVVMVDDPKGNEYYGGEVAAPVFSKVTEGVLRLMNVPPDDLSEKDINAARLAARH